MPHHTHVTGRVHTLPNDQRMYVRMYACMYVCKHHNTLMSLNEFILGRMMNVCMLVCMYVRIYICTYTCIYINT